MDMKDLINKVLNDEDTIYSDRGKICLQCKEVKYFSDYYSSSNKNNNTLSSYCIDCSNKRSKEYKKLRDGKAGEV